MPAVTVAEPTVTQNLLHPSSTSSIFARHLLDLWCRERVENIHQGIKEADTPAIHLDAIPSGL